MAIDQGLDFCQLHIDIVRHACAIGEKNALSRDLTIPHLHLFELWVASVIWLVPSNSHAPVVTEFIVKNRKSQIFDSLPFLY